MQDVVLGIQMTPSLAGGDVVNFYGDGGGGQIDYNNPLNSMPIEVFAGAGQPKRFFEGPWLGGPWLGLVYPPDQTQLFDGPWLGGPWLERSATLISCEAGSYYFGEFKFGSKVLDHAGNVGAADEMAVIINSSPRQPRRLEEPTEDQGILTFGFEGSIDLEN